MPEVSVLMAVYNGERFLEESVLSLLAQSFRNFELLIIDDASRDRSPEILASFRDSRIKIVTLPQNSGLVEALNIAAAQASAPLLARMDADDIAHPDRLRRQVACFSERPSLVLLGTAFNIVNAQGQQIGEQPVQTGSAALSAALLHSNQFAHPTTMFRADAFRACGGYRALAGRHAQDYDLWLRLADAGEVDNLNLPLLQYRVHENQISIDRILSQREASETYRQLALQRKGGRAEDLAAAQAHVAKLQPKIRAACAKELLQMGARLHRTGQVAEAHRLRRRALQLDLLGTVWHELSKSLRWRFEKLFAKGA